MHQGISPVAAEGLSLPGRCTFWIARCMQGDISMCLPRSLRLQLHGRRSQ